MGRGKTPTEGVEEKCTGNATKSDAWGKKSEENTKARGPSRANGPWARRRSLNVETARKGSRVTRPCPRRRWQEGCRNVLDGTSGVGRNADAIWSRTHKKGCRGWAAISRRESARK